MRRRRTRLLISARSYHASARCPACHHVSSRVHRVYDRAPQDLPISGQCWHLIKNRREMGARVLHRLYARLPREQSANERRTRSLSRARRIARYEEVKALCEQGLPILQIARQLHLTRTTV
ncbi:MAG TPA: helix-turn-helix domain-containing protein [Ktedonobacteraceae bacterium]|nr:helix-turn-helix domain-containing protein [Ktedonobacteraceae bacterium]